MSAPCRVLHIHGDSEPSESQARIVQLINAFGRRTAHSFIGDAPAAIDRAITVDPAHDFPSLQGRPTPGRLQRLARAMQGYDLVLTYGYAAIDAALAQTMCGKYLSLPPLVHHEEAVGKNATAHNWVRRIALGRAAALIVVSRRLETIAMAQWHQPRWRVKRISPGIRTADYAAKPRRDALPRVIKREGELWLGAIAEPAAASNLADLLPILADLPPSWQLVIVGEHPQREAIGDEALRLDLGHRVHWPAAVDVGKFIGLFDIFVATADDAQAPTAIIQAMAAGLAVVGTDVGEATALLAPENRPFALATGEGVGPALRTLAQAPDLRARIGRANRKLARLDYDEAAMIAAYCAVYAAALGRDSFP